MLMCEMSFRFSYTSVALPTRLELTYFLLTLSRQSSFYEPIQLNARTLLVLFDLLNVIRSNVRCNKYNLML